MSYKSVKDSLYTILSGISALNQKYDYINPNPEGYPAAFPVFLGSDNSGLDISNDVEGLNFSIRVINRIDYTKATQDAALDVIESVYQNFQGVENRTLTDTALYLEVTGSDVQYTDKEKGPISIIGDIFVKVSVQRFTN